MWTNNKFKPRGYGVTPQDGHFQTSSALDSCLSTLAIDATFDRSAPFLVGSRKATYSVSDDQGNTRNSELKLHCVV